MTEVCIPQILCVCEGPEIIIGISLGEMVRERDRDRHRKRDRGRGRKRCEEKESRREKGR